MVELASENVVRAGAAVVGLLASHRRISKGSLLIPSASTTSGCQLLARVSRGSSETCAGGKDLLCRLSAGEAARLAPAEKAVSLAVRGTILAGCSIALRALGADAGRRGEAGVELVMVELASENVVRAGAAVVGLLASRLRISKRGLLV